MDQQSRIWVGYHSMWGEINTFSRRLLKSFSSNMSFLKNDLFVSIITKFLITQKENEIKPDIAIYICTGQITHTELFMHNERDKSVYDSSSQSHTGRWVLLW